MAPTSRTACKSVATILRNCGTVETNRNTIITLKAPRTANVLLDGTYVIATNIKHSPRVYKNRVPLQKFEALTLYKNKDYCLIK